MKGVSDIIATILMLIITIGLAGTAYVYISGIMTARTAITLSVQAVTCTGSDPGDSFTVVVLNDGTTDVAAGTISISVGGGDPGVQCDENTLALNAHTSGQIICTDGAPLDIQAGTNMFTITAGGSYATGSVYC